MPPPKQPRVEPIPGFHKNGTLSEVAKGVIYGLHLCNKNKSYIAQRCNCDRKVVTAAIEHVQAVIDGQTPVDGRTLPKKLTPARRLLKKRQETIKKIMQKKYRVRGNQWEHAFRSASDVARELFKQTGEVISKSTAVRAIRAQAGTFRRRPVTAALTPERMAARVAAIPRLLKVPAQNIIFSDESLFDCRDMKSHHWVFPGDKPVPRRHTRWTATVHVWGYIGVGVRELIFLDEDRVNSKHYQDTMKRFFVPKWKEMKKRNPNLIFMQDGARSHTSKSTMGWLAKQGVNTLEWPPYSPDWNPIENLWGLIKRKIGIHWYATRDELIDAIEEAWMAIDQDYIDNLVLSFHDRLRRSKEVGGDDAKIAKIFK